MNAGGCGRQRRFQVPAAFRTDADDVDIAAIQHFPVIAVARYAEALPGFLCPGSARTRNRNKAAVVQALNGLGMLNGNRTGADEGEVDGLVVHEWIIFSS